SPGADVFVSADRIVFKGDVFPRPVQSSDDDAREAQAIIDSTDLLFGSAVPIRKETDARIVLSALDRLVQEMIGWRETAAVAPGLPALMIPPLTAPEGWVERDGVIQKRWGGSGY